MISSQREGKVGRSGKGERRKRNYILYKAASGGGTDKTPVAVLVERGGRARAKIIGRPSAAELKGHIRANEHRDAKIVTDDFPSYRGIGKEFAGGHSHVAHTRKE